MIRVHSRLLTANDLRAQTHGIRCRSPVVYKGRYENLDTAGAFRLSFCTAEPGGRGAAGSCRLSHGVQQSRLAGLSPMLGRRPGGVLPFDGSEPDWGEDR